MAQNGSEANQTSSDSASAAQDDVVVPALSHSQDVPKQNQVVPSGALQDTSKHAAVSVAELDTSSLSSDGIRSSRSGSRSNTLAGESRLEEDAAADTSVSSSTDGPDIPSVRQKFLTTPRVSQRHWDMRLSVGNPKEIFLHAIEEISADWIRISSIVNKEGTNSDTMAQLSGLSISIQNFNVGWRVHRSTLEEDVGMLTKAQTVSEVKHLITSHPAYDFVRKHIEIVCALWLKTAPLFEQLATVWRDTHSSEEESLILALQEQVKLFRVEREKYGQDLSALGFPTLPLELDIEVERSHEKFSSLF